MGLNEMLYNLSNPTIMFFLLGVIAVLLKSDLEIPASSSKFISLYLLFAIGFKGGQELSHEALNQEIMISMLFGLLLSAIIPLYSYYLLRLKLDVQNAAAVAAAYGSVSAVTFVAAMSTLDFHHMDSGGHMVAVMALMESPAIVIGVVLLTYYGGESKGELRLGGVIRHAFTNGSVLLILGSLLIGFMADERQAEGIKPFTTDIFKGFLALFLLEMGMVTSRRFSAFKQYGGWMTVFGIVVPLFNGCTVAWMSQWITADPGNRFIFSVLAASASYIAVPAAMRLAAPKADPGLYVPMALGITFPVNLTIGMPLYFSIILSQ
ncbi:MAG: hypothetical protein RLY35_172 [Bacteroidota bacterium]|jgi:hypothetical protein